MAAGKEQNLRHIEDAALKVAVEDIVSVVEEWSGHWTTRDHQHACLQADLDNPPPGVTCFLWGYKDCEMDARLFLFKQNKIFGFPPCMLDPSHLY